MKTIDKDVTTLKSIADNIINYMENGIVFFANIKNDSVNFIAKSNCSVNAGYIVKMASNKALGNGGGSPTFAQGGGHDISVIDDVLELVTKEINDEK